MATSARKITRRLLSAVAAGGIVSIIIGLATMLWPGLILNIFIYIFSIFVLVVSVVTLARSISNVGVDRLWWMSTVFSIIGVCAGLYIIMNPGTVVGLIGVLLAIYIFIQSIMDLMVASYNDDRETKMPMVITGIVGVIFGFIVLFFPRLSSAAMVWVIGLYIFLHGLAVEFSAVRIKRGVKKLAKEFRQTMDEVGDDIKEAEVVDESKKKSGKKNKKSRK